MKTKIIYIAGLGHSGSTFLQFLLASKANLVGLGEINQLATNNSLDSSLLCSCGANIGECEIWGKMCQFDKIDTSLWYEKLANLLLEKYPQTDGWIDSSKQIKGISSWVEVKKKNDIKDIRVLFLVRDVRGWCISQQKNCARKNLPQRSLLFYAGSWWNYQRQTLKKLKELELNYKIVSYENLVFKTESVLDDIFRFLELTPKDKTMLESPWEEMVHDVLGNRMKNNHKARLYITYDDSWHRSAKVNLLVRLLIPVWNLNKKLREEASYSGY